MTDAVPQHENAISDGNRVRNRLSQEKYEPEETPLRESRVFELSFSTPTGFITN